MTPLIEAEQTDALIDACLFCDAQSIVEAIEKGADINRPNHLGLFPVHVLIDPGNNETDCTQASCLALLLFHGAKINKKHRNAYTVCERISNFLPHCALAVIGHLKSLPEDYGNLEKEQQFWWDQLFGRWKSDQEAGSLLFQTATAQGDRGKSRL